MTKYEIKTIENLIAHLQSNNGGCSLPFDIGRFQMEDAAAHNQVIMTRQYLDTWVIGPLIMLLREIDGRPNPDYDPEIAASMANKG